MIAGLLQNRNSNNIEKAPFLGDLPILGMLFRSTSFQRDETELVIIVTPYLVRPTSGQLALPSDGYRAPTDVQLNIEGQSFIGRSGPPAAVGRRHANRRGAGRRQSGIQAVIRGLQRKDAMMRCKLGFVLLATTLAGCGHVPYDEPSRGVSTVNVPVLTRSELCVRRGRS